MSARTPESTPLLHHRSYLSPYQKTLWYKRKKFYLNLIRRSMAEFLSTGLFVFVAVSSFSNVNAEPRSNVLASSSTAIGLAHGLAYAALMAASMHVSGGHLNPAVTLGVFIAGGINVLAAVCYFFAQMIGGLAGAACVLAYDSSTIVNTTWPIVNLGVTRVGMEFSASQAILIEMLLSLMFVMVHLHTTMEAPERRAMAPLATGFALTASVISSYYITGGSLNPARSFGPAVLASIWDDHYVYWVGPFLGSLLAGLLYRLFLSSKPLLPLSDNEPQKTLTIPTHNH